MNKRTGLDLVGTSVAALLLAFCGCALINPPQKATIQEALLDLKVTEIMYHPMGYDTISGDEYEFIELKNYGSAEIDLSNTAFSAGIEYEFPGGTSLAPDSFIVVASNSSEFQRRYGFRPIGEFSGKLSNAGETIAFNDLAANAEVFSISYSDQSPWPVQADGSGQSLVPVTTSAAGEMNSASYWRASSGIIGSPGRDDPEPLY